MKSFLYLTLLLFLSSIFNLNASDIQIINLKTEYAENPLGIDVKNPRFSWQMNAEGRGRYQTAYQIIVKEESDLEVWNSGKINSTISLNVKYAGQALKPCTRYSWEISVWDEKNKKFTASSWFETGLMNPDPNLSAWSEAKWIGGGNNDPVLYASYLPVFKINFSITLDEQLKSNRAGFIYGANDSRLMDKNKNLFQLENEKDSSYLLLELDISPLKSDKNVLFHIYRVGYHPQDTKDVPLKSFPVPLSIINNKNKYKVHDITITSVLGYTHIYIDGSEKENLIGEINLNPLGRGGDFIAFPVLSEIGFNVPEGQRAYFSNLEVRNYRDPSNVLFSENPGVQTYSSIFKRYEKDLVVKGNSYQIKGKKNGTVIIADPSINSMPMLRSCFSTKENKHIAKARLYCTARGIYDLYMNGNRIGEDFFNPGLTQYNRTHLYQTYDVTDYILQGKNAIGAILGEGWWSGGATFMGDFWNFFGDRQSLLAKLIVSYTDGSEDIVVTDPSTWTYFNNGPVIYSSFFQGEVYDASKESLIENWSTASYDDSGWRKAEIISLENVICRDDLINRQHNMPEVSNYDEMLLVGQFGETVKKIKELSAIAVEEVRPGVFVYDMGQNMAGVPKISLNNMSPGQKIVLRFAEVKYPDLPEYKENTDMIMLENIRAAMAQDIYITKGGHEEINPRFTFHGYRFVEITGISQALPLEAVKGEVLSSVHQLASEYKTSNSKVNKLWENICWSTFSNFISIPTDCPQRNERLGWSGDISVFSRTATYLGNVNQFLRRHMLAMRDTQRKDGRFSDVAPLGGGFGGLLWGSAGITVAWESYLQYEDREMLTEHYDAMSAYIDYLLEKNFDKETGILTQENQGYWGNLGDWLSLEDKKNDKTLLWEAYFIYDLELMKKIASVLGKAEDANRFEKLYNERKMFFNETYIDKQDGKTIHSGFGLKKENDLEKKIVDSQVSYVLPLSFGILNEENKAKVLDNFKITIERENKADTETDCPPYSLMTGFIGTAWINKALSDHNCTDIAYRLLQQTSYPSWLYSVEQGATTIWERLNSYTHEAGFGGNNRMNSFNHYSFGAIGAWMYNYSLGIERDENFPGFKHFILKPEPDPTGEMSYAGGYYDSMYGRIESSWTIDQEACNYRFVVPANTSATLYLKSDALNNITEKGKAFISATGVKYQGSTAKIHTFELQSGNYEIRVKR